MSEIDRLPEPHSALSRLAFPLIRAFLWGVYALFGGPSVWFGARRVPRHGPLLIVVNHQSNCDPPFVQLVTPRLIHFMARRQLWDWPGIVGKMVRTWRAFPISQATADRAALKNAVELLNLGRCVAIFPEGQLSPDGRLLPMFPGAALIIRRAKVPCICLGIRNTRRVMPHPETTPRWAGCWLQGHWGEPRTFDDHASEEEIMGWITAELSRLTGQPSSSDA